MSLQLIEFKSHKGEILRGLLSDAKKGTGVVFAHGFERTTVESKFKNIVSKLSDKASTFRFDFSGCGLSDGSFEDITASKCVRELKNAVSVFKEACPRVKKIVLVSHSFGCCAAIKFMSENNGVVDRAVFLGPAFNQKMLHRFWFASSKNKEREITWANFREFLNEKEFEEEMNKPKKMSKEHFISSAYFLENKEADYQEFIKKSGAKMLLVHGDKDDKVPQESNDKISAIGNLEILSIKNGDHDLQRMDMVCQYEDKVREFILKE